MIWNVKKIKETKDLLIIAYSKNSSFDGNIKYDKKTEEFEIVIKASDCDEFDSKRLFQFLYTLISQETLSFVPYVIRIG